MPDIDLSIIRIGDEPPWPELAHVQERGELVHLRDGHWKAAIIEHGMESGNASVALRIQLPDGKILVAETSLAVWSSVTIAARAAFPEQFAGGPLSS